MFNIVLEKQMYFKLFTFSYTLTNFNPGRSYKQNIKLKILLCLTKSNILQF